MRWISILRLRWRSLVDRRAIDGELDEELRYHLDRQVELFVARGMTAQAARDAALRDMGGMARRTEECRDARGLTFLDARRQDLRYACRTLRKSPVFTAVAVLTIALGIGANTAIFSVVHAAILQPLDYPHPERLMFLSTGASDADQGALSPAEYFELTELSRSFSAIGAFVTGEANLSADDRPRRLSRARVNAELLEALAVAPARGRWFRRDETRAGGPPLVILSNELWRSAFAGREGIVGQAVEIDGVSHEVVGVMPQGADLMDKRVELWLPLQLAPALRQFRASHFLSVVARLQDGVTSAQAHAELTALVAVWGERAGVSGHVFTPGEHVLRMGPLLDAVVGPVWRAFCVLQAAVGLVLLVACANLANLLLVRAEGRGREIAVRLALGATARRLLALFVAEGLVVLVLGSAAGLAIAWVSVRALMAAYPGSVPRATGLGLDPAVLGFTLLVAAITGLVFALAPLRFLSRRRGDHLLNERTAVAPARPWLRRTLVAGEVALAVVLTAGAGLMVRTVTNLMGVDAGFERSRLVTFGIALPAASYPAFEQRADLYQRLIDRFRAVPGVDGVAAVSGLPPQREYNGYGSDIEGYTPPPDRSELVGYFQTVTSGYFDTMRIPVVRGRGFEPADRGGAPVAMVNEAFVRTFWKGLEPIGRRVRPRFGDKTPWVTVIGVAKDVKQGGVDRPVSTEVYFLLDQLPRVFPAVSGARLGSGFGDGSLHLLLRSALPADALQPTVARLVAEADPSLPVIRLRDMEDVFRDSVRRPRMLMQLLAGFAGLALVLAAIGLYGVLSYMVTQQRREIGVRLALGAGRAVVLRAVVGHGLKLTCAGLAAGLAAALVLTRSMTSLLFDVRPADPATLAAATVAIAGVAAAACLIPALRATRVDPVVALRDE